ncbi:MAG: nucleoside-diphosphate kinase [Verrucomicrobia bacterium CG_4_10_14_3_um_filter_43_23]|nr:MAG: nucleoside-diphosphate kinase [Verrucomicrobia bacterium CG1_02_43_26]PIP58839.1 MAG: nucleoside-diphosphate kinase [Verrucomicrobia bacterium CG22_combo_CG10-13_8_21_14_all_43_17]PIX57763.1 MAG: nucleoside-diphosphate kinase [Verrucomicrobia bacterium CG_4_10_14_3_um_filter_43_23]PIY61071.1 MAG: nucleoside-diphosphate kinase [Verrucomicrobia bacterium CG_4_10_14_0_8_um_filter_43_34]PJA44231.1 MAG: nucleoside-diphosphate kinase [Verrucomicrobia bacterium CG_4_9_14_3_um_filter_43_20]
MEKTLIILKPDCMNANLAGAVLERLCKAGLKIVACKMQALSERLLREHYSHHADKPFFPEIVKFMQSAPVMIVILEGENAIELTRELLGPTDSTIAPKGTIRGDMGKGKMENIAHASDSPEAAADEIERFFASEEVFA